MIHSTRIGAIALLVSALPAAADDDHAQPQATGEETAGHMQQMMAAGLILPKMDAAEGRRLFASTGCVVCHSVNGVGGEHAPMLDAEFMDLPMNPFEFAARMWRGAEAMVELQREELGGPIELTGEELADIIAFVHDADEQKRFTDTDIPEDIEAMMHGAGEHAHGHDDGHMEGEGHADADDHG